MGGVGQIHWYSCRHHTSHVICFGCWGVDLLLREYSTNMLWQSSWPASFSPAGLTLWPNWLERWLATLSRLSTQVRIPVGLSVLGHHIGGSSAGLGKTQRIDSSLRPTDCHVSLWPVENGGLPDRGVWCHWGREECDNPAGLLASRQMVWLFGWIG